MRAERLAWKLMRRVQIRQARLNAWTLATGPGQCVPVDLLVLVAARV
jgi:hypothetical protein